MADPRPEIARQAVHEEALKRIEDVSEFERGVRAGLRRASQEASQFSVRVNKNLHPDIPWDKMSDSAKLIAHMVAQCISADIAALSHNPEGDDHGPALSASAPAREGVVVRVAVAIDEQGRGHTRQIGNSHASTEAEAWDDLLEWNEADRRSCIATIVAPIPTLPEIAASVQPAGDG